MTDLALATARSVAASWQEEVERRRRISKHDPVAEALESCAAELIDRLREVDAPGAMRTVEQYAQAKGVTPQCVRRWIGRGMLEATKTPHGYRILHTAEPRRKTA